MMSRFVTYSCAHLGNDLITGFGQVLHVLSMRGGLGYCRGYCRIFALGADDTLTV